MHYRPSIWTMEGFYDIGQYWRVGLDEFTRGRE